MRPAYGGAGCGGRLQICGCTRAASAGRAGVRRRGMARGQPRRGAANPSLPALADDGGRISGSARVSDPAMGCRPEDPDREILGVGFAGRRDPLSGALPLDAGQAGSGSGRRGRSILGAVHAHPDCGGQLGGPVPTIPLISIVSAPRIRCCAQMGAGGVSARHGMEVTRFARLQVPPGSDDPVRLVRDPQARGTAGAAIWPHHFAESWAARGAGLRCRSPGLWGLTLG